MKKVLLLILIVLIPFKHFAKEQVILEKCVDGDTAWFKQENEIIKARFLAIDSPESTNKKEPFGNEASLFTCGQLELANKINIEYDPNSDKFDKYGRALVWVYVDDVLLQEKLVQNGLAKVAYLYGDYLYTHKLQTLEKEAKEMKLNIWQDYQPTLEERIMTFIENNPWVIIIFIIFILFVFYLLSPKDRNKFFKEVTKQTKKYIKKKK